MEQHVQYVLPDIIVMEKIDIRVLRQSIVQVELVLIHQRVQLQNIVQAEPVQHHQHVLPEVIVQVVVVKLLHIVRQVLGVTPEPVKQVSVHNHCVVQGIIVIKEQEQNVV